MNGSNFSANIMMREMKQTFSAKNETMLTLSILYPQVGLPYNQSSQSRINHRIQTQVSDFYRYASQTLYKQSISYYRYAQENGFPFHSYEAVLNYEITYNQHCYLSMYRDQYTFTGGAHGSTIRASDTYSIKSGHHVPLSSFFKPKEDYRQVLLSQIQRLANEQMRQDPHIYFENYSSLIEEEFNENNYYLQSSGVSIYFQQYEIAPYASGIIVFTAPYEMLQWRPSCKLH
ncbi:MAG: DUF3298 and DUF4163 domain-containing protein [Christensenellales bacterium]